MAESRSRTLAHAPMPDGERFTIEYVTGKPWSGYNWYKGGAHSLIEINTDLPIYISRALDLGCHEGYPGHHVLNAMLEQKLTKERGWIEFSVYPLYSPQSFIAEGSANFGIELAFPGEAKTAFDVSYALMVRELPVVAKRGAIKNGSGQVQSRYARFDATVGLLSEPGSPHTFRVWGDDKKLWESPPLSDPTILKMSSPLNRNWAIQERSSPSVAVGSSARISSRIEAFQSSPDSC